MIIKNFEISKINLKTSKLILFYGKNEGHKDEIISNLLKNKEDISSYDEKDIIENENTFIENILTKSLFENEKIIIIKRLQIKFLKLLVK